MGEQQPPGYDLSAANQLHERIPADQVQVVRSIQHTTIKDIHTGEEVAVKLVDTGEEHLFSIPRSERRRRFLIPALRRHVMTPEERDRVYAGIKTHVYYVRPIADAAEPTSSNDVDNQYQLRKGEE